MKILPRMTVGRWLGAMVPLAAYLGLWTQLARGPVGLTRAEARTRAIAWGLELFLLAASGAAVARYRRASFRGSVVQMTATPASGLALAWVGSVHSRPEVLLFVGSSYALVAMIYFTFTATSRGRATIPGYGGDAESVVAGIANLGLVLIVVVVEISCIFSWAPTHRFGFSP